MKYFFKNDWRSTECILCVPEPERSICTGRNKEKVCLHEWRYRRGSERTVDLTRAFDQNEFLRNLWINYYPGPGLDKPDFSSVLKQIDLWLDGHSEMESFWHPTLFIVVDTSRQESYDKCICSMTQTESVSETL